MKRSNRGWITWLCGLFVGYMVLQATGAIGPQPSFIGGSGSYAIKATGQQAKVAQSFPMTTFRAHAPGFSVIDNL
jgi:hypothetical protein